MCTPASLPSCAIRVSGPIGLLITACDRCPAAVRNVIGVPFSLGPGRCSGRREPVDGVIGGAPQVLDRVGAPWPPSLRAPGQGRGRGAQPERCGGPPYAKGGRGESGWITEAAHGDDPQPPQ